MLAPKIAIAIITVCFLVGFPIFANAEYTQNIEIRLISDTFNFGEKLDYTIFVSEITGEDAIIYIIDTTGVKSRLFSTPISQEETRVIAPIGFDSVIWNEGKYLLELEYSGFTSKTDFTIIDDGSIGIPYWIKDVAKLWITNQIPDKEYAKSIQYLIKQEILNSTPGDNLQIPEWVKFTTGWWAYGQITDTTYANAIQFLIDDKILVVVYE